MVSQRIRKPLVWGLAALIGAYLAFGVFGVQALFINNTVDEAAPVALIRATSAPLPGPTALASTPVPATVAAPTEKPTAAPTQQPAIAPTEKPTAAPPQKPAPPPQKPAPPPQKPTAVPTIAPTVAPTPEPAPPAPPAPEGPVVIATGQFHNVTHAGTGTVIVFRNPDGSHGLRFENLNVENGPDLYVYAVATEDAQNARTVLDAGFVNVAKLKANRGNQNYALPADFNPAIHRSISIWCQRFSVNFVTAPLR